MNDQQKRVIRRFRRLVKDAHKAGLVLAVDAGVWGVRFITQEDEKAADDLVDVGECVDFGPGEEVALRRWESGETVSVDTACNTPSNKCTVM